MVAKRKYERYQSQEEVRRYKLRKREDENKVAANFARKKAALATAVVIGSLALCILILSAVASSIAFNNNLLSEKNKELANDIKRLNVKVQEGSSRSQIVDLAESKLGMIHPTSSQFVMLNSETNEENFAEKLREEAFR